MIQIIRGVYGHYVTDEETGKTRVVARDKHSDPIELTEEQEARLVSQAWPDMWTTLLPLRPPSALTSSRPSSRTVWSESLSTAKT